MKWSILGLFVLGVLAAIASVVLMISLQSKAPVVERETPTEAPSHTEEPRSVQVLVAASDLELRSIVQADDVEIRSVDEKAAPREYFSDPVQVIGKVLILPMPRGRAFSSEDFATESSGLLLATALVPGSRAVSITLSDHLGIEKLLFPGCMVDVIATIEFDRPDIGKVPVTFTLLEKVMVLAVGESSIVEGESSPDEESATGRNRPPVTLLLDANQAELVKLATEKGSVSISMRNPMDESVSSGEAKGLARLSPTLAEVERLANVAMMKKAGEEGEKRGYEMERERIGIQKARDEAELARMKYEQDKRALEEQEKRVEAWEITVLRGSTAQTQSFPKPDSKDEH
jgi:pilus assembly protein CpaB